MEKFNFFKRNKKMEEVKPKTEEEPTEKLLDRRKFLKMAGGALAGLALSDVSLLSKALEASELKESLDWNEGISSLLKDVFESKVETAGVFIESTDKEHSWKNIQDGQLAQISVDPKQIVEGIKSLGIQNKNIAKIIHLHSHPLHSFSETSKNQPEEAIERFVNSKQKKGIILPPSEADMDILPAREGAKADAWKTAFEEGGLDYEMVQQGVVEPSGVWLYSKINPKKLPPNSPLKKYLENKEVLKKAWGGLWENKLKNKMETTPIEELKKLLLIHSSDRIKAYLQKTTPASPEAIKTLFKGALTYSSGLIDSFVDGESRPLALAHQKITVQSSKIDNNFKNTFNGVCEKSAKGEASKKDIEELIETARWKQVELSFTPHSEKLLNSVGAR